MVSVEVWQGSSEVLDAAFSRLCAQGHVRLHVQDGVFLPAPLVPSPRILVLGATRLPAVPQGTERMVVDGRLMSGPPEGVRMVDMSLGSVADVERLASYFGASSPLSPELASDVLEKGPARAARWLRLLRFCSPKVALELAGGEDAPSDLLAWLQSASVSQVSAVASSLGRSRAERLVLEASRSSFFDAHSCAHAFRLCRYDVPAALVLLRSSLA